MQTKCAHAPWASYNTPQIGLIQYGRRIGKKGLLVLLVTNFNNKNKFANSDVFYKC